MNESVPQNVSASEISFLAAVPRNWKILDLKFVATISPSNVDKKSVDDQPPVLLCNYTDVYYNDVIHRNLRFMKATATHEQIEKFTLKKWDVLFTKDSETADDIGIPALVAQNLDGVLCGYHLAILRAHTSSVGPYLKYCLESTPSKAYFECTANGLTRVGLGQYAINNLPVCVPPFYEQRQIAAYLNRETAKIDNLIAKQQKLITLLQEKRQAVISQAVTKGLDPKVKMKDSGVEWLGAVPEHWKVGLSKRFLGTLSGFAFPSAGFSADEADPKLLRGINVGVSQLRWNDVVYWKRSRGDKLDDFELEVGDIVLGMDRPLIGKGLRIASVTNADLPCLLLQRVLKFNFGKDLLSGYFKLLMEGGFFAAFIEPDMTGVSVPHISPTQVENFKIPVPPIQEQLSILEFITRKVAMFSNLINKSENSIKLLYEHRQALITAAVTGKIDVRGLVTDEEVAALDADPALEATDEDFESEVAEADYITEEE